MRVAASPGYEPANLGVSQGRAWGLPTAGRPLSPRSPLSARIKSSPARRILNSNSHADATLASLLVALPKHSSSKERARRPVFVLASHRTMAFRRSGAALAVIALASCMLLAAVPRVSAGG